jgi:membrane-bound lytic murein transglycosylase B
VKPILFVLALLVSCGAAADYSKRPEVQGFVRDLAERHGFAEADLLSLFARVKRTEPVLQAIQLPPEKTRSWPEYRATFIQDGRIAAGLAFWNANQKALERAEQVYGVPPEYILGILGVETFYGRQTGRYRVLDALTTLAFDYAPRGQYFRNELENYLLLARANGLDALSMRGSYAGAIGMPQFMPGSARRYAVDFDGDGAIDLRTNAADAIGSVANFLKEHGWQAGREVLLTARVEGEAYKPYADGRLEPRYPIAELVRSGVQIEKLTSELEAERGTLIELPSTRDPSEWRVGLKNFHVLTRYNRSAFYAAAVTDLARELRARRKSAPELEPIQE